MSQSDLAKRPYHWGERGYRQGSRPATGASPWRGENLSSRAGTDKRRKRLKQDLERETKKSIFESRSDGRVRCRRGASPRFKSLPGPIDGLVMNAGGAGGKAPMALTKDGVTYSVRFQRLGARCPAGWFDPLRATDSGGGLPRKRSRLRRSEAGHEAARSSHVIRSGVCGRLHRQELRRHKVRLRARVWRGQVCRRICGWPRQLGKIPLSGWSP